MPMTSRVRQPRSVSFVFGGISLVLLALIAVLAAVFVPPSPPRIAEFAPRAEDTIDVADSAKSSQFGRSPGGCAAEPCEDGAGLVQPLPPRAVVERARVRRCVGSPPRQTEDPQSPPCVSYWAGDNGGATSRGVTRDEIRVSITRPNQMEVKEILTLVEFFNRRYEFYGRKIKPFILNRASFGSAGDPVVQRAQAVKVDEEFRAFGSIGGVADPAYGDGTAFYDELARRKIIAVDPEPPYRMSADLAAARPYLWTYAPPLDVAQVSAGEFICKNLAGRNAEYAEDPILQISPRKFGIAVAQHKAGTPSDAALISALRRCGASFGRYTIDGDDPQGPLGRGSDYNNLAVARMQADGVTSVVCICTQLVFAYGLIVSANNNAYGPEWVVSGVGGQGSDDMTTSDRRQYSHLFGVTGQNKHLSPGYEPFSWAIKEVDPTVRSWTDSNYVRAYYRHVYTGLLLLASGLQMAGPHLTPASFEQGLRKTDFPNPGAGAAPAWQARVGFKDGRHNMVNDFTPVWHTYTHDLPPGYSDRTDMGWWCFVDRGARHGAGSWPSGGFRFFDVTRPCR